MESLSIVDRSHAQPSKRPQRMRTAAQGLEYGPGTRSKKILVRISVLDPLGAQTVCPNPAL